MTEKDIQKRPAYLEVISEDTIKECRRAMQVIRSVRLSFNNPGEIRKLFALSQELIGIQAWLVGELLASEQDYRIKFEAYRQAEWNTKKSVSTAESAAKATPDYSAYKFLQYVYDLCTDQINLLKKFSDKVEDEKMRLH